LKLNNDSFEGEVVDPDALSDPVKRAAFDIPAFVGRHSKDRVFPFVLDTAKRLKSQYPKVAAIGYCYGAWAVFKLGADPSLIDAATVAHPSLLETSEIDAIKVPIQILSPEHDPAYTPELKEYSNKVIPTLNVPYEYVYFPGVAHGFAARGDPNDKAQKEALERAKRSSVAWFKEWLQ
jgi:dienelactone hydrolase